MLCLNRTLIARSEVGAGKGPQPLYDPCSSGGEVGEFGYCGLPRVRIIPFSVVRQVAQSVRPWSGEPVVVSMRERTGSSKTIRTLSSRSALPAVRRAWVDSLELRRRCICSARLDHQPSGH